MLKSIIECNTITNQWTYKLDEQYRDSLSIFRINISQCTFLIENHIDILTSEEIVRLNRYCHLADKRRFAAGRCALRILLGLRCNTSPQEVHLTRGRNGKPEVAAATLHYSISYSGDYILLVISNTAVGIDIEKINHNFDFQDVVSNCFACCECDVIANSEHRLKSFYQLWTRKEALVKATGKGIDDDFSNIPALGGTHSVNADMLATSIKWTTSSFAVATSYAAAVSYPASVFTNEIGFYNLNFELLGQASKFRLNLSV